MYSFTRLFSAAIFMALLTIFVVQFGVQDGSQMLEPETGVERFLADPAPELVSLTGMHKAHRVGQPTVDLAQYIRTAFRQLAKASRQIAGVQMAAGAVVDFFLIEFGA